MRKITKRSAAIIAATVVGKPGPTSSISSKPEPNDPATAKPRPSSATTHDPAPTAPRLTASA